MKMDLSSTLHTRVTHDGWDFNNDLKLLDYFVFKVEFGFRITFIFLFENSKKKSKSWHECDKRVNKLHTVVSEVLSIVVHAGSKG